MMTDSERSVLLTEYDKAQDSAEHHDTLSWEVTAIIWGASTLLLGFIIEALATEAKSESLIVIVVTAILGIFLTWLAYKLMLTNNKITRLKYALCRDIEANGGLRMKYRQHTKTEEVYKREKLHRKQRWLHLLVTLAFTVVWGWVLVVSLWRLADLHPVLLWVIEQVEW